MGPNFQLIYRPRRFGKSLTVNMLRAFHRIEYRGEYDQLFAVYRHNIRLSVIYVTDPESGS